MISKGSHVLRCPRIKLSSSFKSMCPYFSWNVARLLHNITRRSRDHSSNPHTCESAEWHLCNPKGKTYLRDTGNATTVPPRSLEMFLKTSFPHLRKLLKMYDIKRALYVYGARERSSYIQIDCIRSYTVTSGLHTFRSLQNFKCILRAFNYPDNGGDCAFVTVCLWERRLQKLSTDLDAVLLIDEKCYNKDEITLSTSIHPRGVREANFGLQVYGVYPCMARLQRRQCRSTIRAPNNVGSYTMWRKTTKFIMKTRLGELMILRYSGGQFFSLFLCTLTLFGAELPPGVWSYDRMTL